MHSLRHFTRILRSDSKRSLASRYASSGVPWFMDEPEAHHRMPPPHLPSTTHSPVPEDAPQTIKQLHAELSNSPHLDRSTLIVSQAIPPSPGPALPLRSPQGRRRRGGTYSGDSMYDGSNGIWDWVVIAQVKEGTENRGSIESVVRVVRKTLLSDGGLVLPPKSRRQMGTGWAMIDAGKFAVHVLSREARYIISISTLLLSQSAKAVDVYPGVANPTAAGGGTDPMSANFVLDPTTESTGAGAGPDFQGHKQAQKNFKDTAGVVEGRPGILESANIDPLNENSNKDDGWANATSKSTGSTGGTTSNLVSNVSSVASGAARMAYGHVVGDEDAQKRPCLEVNNVI